MTDQTPPTDPLAELRDQIRATTEAAARLAQETADAKVPPSGWATSEEQAERQQELQALVALVEALRDLVPPELKAQVRDVLRQLLLLLRALIDWWVERMDGPAAAGPARDVQEIPVD